MWRGVDSWPSLEIFLECPSEGSTREPPVHATPMAFVVMVLAFICLMRGGSGEGKKGGEGGGGAKRKGREVGEVMEEGKEREGGGNGREADI